jgi:hypothetical protein
VKQIMTKIVGTIISILSLAVAMFSALALANANEMANMLSLAVKEFDITEWQQRWKLSSYLYLLSACIGLFAGIGIFRNRRWAFLVFALILSMHSIGHLFIMISDYAMFEFERMNSIELSVVILCCFFAWYLYSRNLKGKIT